MYEVNESKASERNIIHLQKEKQKMYPKPKNVRRKRQKQ